MVAPEGWTPRRPLFIQSKVPNDYPHGFHRSVFKSPMNGKHGSVMATILDRLTVMFNGH